MSAAPFLFSPVCLGPAASSDPTKWLRRLVRTSWVGTWSLVCVLLGSPRGYRRACWYECQLLPFLHGRVAAGPRLMVLPFAFGLWLALCRAGWWEASFSLLKQFIRCPCPLSCAKRRDKSKMQTCKLIAVKSAFPSLPPTGLSSLRT